MPKVLVIDDDPSLLRAMRLGLRASGHEVICAAGAELGISLVARITPDVVILDLGLPDVDGLTACRRIRQWRDVPIIVLSATDAEERKVAALDLGADDYVTKPFGMSELEARIRTAIRHRRVEAEDLPAKISVGPIELDIIHREARVEGRNVELTAKEFDVLAYLARHAAKTCTRQMILVAVWGPAYAHEVQYLHAYVHRLRQKIHDPEGSLLRTAPGIGYSLVPPPQPVVEP